ncbi:hypothetical protein [Rhodomicrobium lacus]|uniref:hypothetical protein n=1 Tax=Rhodomicrobium lacus TaxID=2498452 RepID=UPI000F8E2750|nr:hypothetical protein [Rhodomicrobium lacus]
MTAHAACTRMPSGIAVDLLRPAPEQIDFNDLAEVLSRIDHTGGRCASGVYSVAQHCVIGADAVARETGSDALAATFLFHAAHEAYLGRTAQAALVAYGAWFAAAARLDQEFQATMPRETIVPAARRAAEAAFDDLKYTILSTVHQAAGLEWPLSDAAMARLLHVDRRLHNTEAVQLLGETLPPDEPTLRVMGKLGLWPWPMAADEYRARVERYAPRVGRLRGRQRSSITRSVRASAAA